MSVWAAPIGGIAGTLILTTVLRAASELRLTRIDLPFLLGTVVTVGPERAKLIGYLVHVVDRLAFLVGVLRRVRRARAVGVAPRCRRSVRSTGCSP